MRSLLAFVEGEFIKSTQHGEPALLKFPVGINPLQHIGALMLLKEGRKERKKEV